MTRTRLLALGVAAAGAVLLSGCAGGDDAPLPAGVAVPGITEMSADTPIAPPAPVPAPPVGDDADDRWDDDRWDDIDDRDDDRDDRDDDLDDRDDDRDDVDDLDDDDRWDD
ncbi:hypothetical protein [Actinomycetospora termitidis]|uniref:Uncharacterized protein n=1 Tax=Actinomycetospora termitidis TaxID=3053470 RepID=A0ABT7M314_9PSEU|nr:hypothetical protein [Actinomycetospora sp. Odt1-22]MDL5155055.1 hypothetical protein [Actinomycetospora sp. Odt1-22]